MISVVKAAGATKANGALAFVYQGTDGVLKDVFSGGFQILDADGVAVGAPGTLHMVNDRVGAGRYHATWAPGAAGIGRYTVRWTYVVTNGGASVSFDQEFELVDTAYSGVNYCSIYDLRAEGLSAAVCSDVTAQKAIVRASRYIEHFTGRKFFPQFRTMELDGRGAKKLLLNEPIVAVESVYTSEDRDFTAGTLVDLSGTRIYNRHLTDGLTSPDDRDNPKIELVGGVSFLSIGIWPKGVRNIQINGLFGYTESDGSFVGNTPALVREACKLLCFKNLTPIATRSSEAAGGARIIVAESTRDQSVTYASPPTQHGGTFTGDWEIDNILIGFRRLPAMGSV
jgi:hypothetical protein